MAMKRSASGSGIDTNRNTQPIGQRGFWLYYALLLLAVRIFIGTLIHFITHTTSNKHYIQYSWSITHILHSLITFYIMHWKKGTPYESQYNNQGEYDRDTYWEQIDQGKQYTNTKKIFMLVPVVLFLLSAYETQWRNEIMMIDFIFLFLGVIPKLPIMDHVRLGGINKD